KLYATEPALFVENPSSPGRIIPKPKAATMQTPVMRERLVEHALQYFGYEISVLRQLAAEGLDVNDEIASLAQRVKHRVQEIQKDLPQVILDPDNVSVDVSNLENFSIVRDVEDRLARYAKTARQQPSSVKSVPQSQAPSSAGFVSGISQLTFSQRDITSLLAVIGKPDYDPQTDGDLVGIGSDKADLSSYSSDPIGIDKERYDVQKDLRKVKLLTDLTGRYADQALADILNASGYTRDEAVQIVSEPTSADVRNQFRAVIKDLFENIVDAYMQRVDRGLGAEYKSDGLLYAEKLNIEFKVERRPEGRGNLVRLSIAANGIDLDHDRLAVRSENADLISGRLEASGDKLGQTQDSSKDNAWRRLGGHNLGQSIVQSGLGRIPGFVSYSLKGRYEHPEFGGEYGSVSEITFDAASLNDEVTAARLSSDRDIPKFEDVAVTDDDIIAAVSELVPQGVEDREKVIQHYARVVQTIRNINQDMVNARQKLQQLSFTYTLSDVDKRTLPEVQKKLGLFEIPSMIRSLVQINGSTPSKPLRVLDIGAGNGTFLADLSANLPDGVRDSVVLIGIEPWSYPEREDGIDIRRGYFEYDSLENYGNQGFDLILGTEVLQYAYDRVDFVEQITKFLNPNGLAVIGNSSEYNNEAYGKTVNSFNISNKIGRLIIDQNSKPINQIKLMHLEVGARLADGQNQDSLRARLNTGAFTARNIAVNEQLLAGVSDDIIGHAAKTNQQYSLNSENGAFVISAERTKQGFRLRGQSGDSIAERVISRADTESSLSVPDLSLREPVSSLLAAGSRLAVQSGFTLFSSKRDPQLLRVVQQFKRIRNQQDERMQLGELRLNLDGLITESMRQQAAETGVVPQEYLDLLNAWKSGVSFAETFGGHFSVSVLNVEDPISQIFLQEALKAGFGPDINDPAKSITYITPYLQTTDGTEFDNGEGETANVSNFAYRDTETGNPQGDIIANTNRVLITAAAINYRKSMKLSGQKEGFSRELSRALADVLYGKGSNPDRIADEDQLIEQASGENSHVYRRSLFENFLFTVQAIWSEIREQIISDQAAEWSA
ncbi:MAG: class I SAM-dependent methyltransferase, partial [Candidatus Omnitrophica bacterium]|nr:class I SAM-dependent methyltransferase [Candidatus Omnitrophota bacterium]